MALSATLLPRVDPDHGTKADTADIMQGRAARQRMKCACVERNEDRKKRG